MSRIQRILLSILLAVLASGAIWAGFWQLRRLAQRRSANAAVLAGRDLPPLDLNLALQQQTPVEGRRAIARGHFVASAQLLLRGREENDVPGLHVVTPFVLDGTTSSVWVLRGFVASPDAITPPADIPAPGDSLLTISGLMLPIPVTPDSGQPLGVARDTTWRRIDQRVLAARVPGSLPEYLQLEGERAGPGRLPSVPPPDVDEGPHLSYAIQWFGIAAAIVAFTWIFVLRGARKEEGERSKERDTR